MLIAVFKSPFFLEGRYLFLRTALKEECSKKLKDICGYKTNSGVTNPI